MAEDTWSKLTRALVPQSQSAPAARSSPSPVLVVDHGRQAYEAFDNQVRALKVEIRCHRTGMSYSIPYAHMGGIVFHFRTGRELSFTGCGFAITVTGRGLRHILMALNLHVCSFVQDFCPEAHILPEPLDPDAAFVESVSVEVLRPTATHEVNGGSPPVPAGR